jgi:hypothetical protein
MAERLKRVLPEIVFVGGCTTGLLITDPAASPVRATDDVDVIEARNRLPGACRSTFPMMIRCVLVTKRFTRPFTCKAGAHCGAS